MSDRGMMKWIPYKSLIEQDEELKKWRINRDKVDKPVLLEDKINEINESLMNYHNQEIIATYFNNGYIIKVKGIIKKIDQYDQSLLVEDTKIPLRDLLDINNVD
jgi:DNA-binding winged helix-turn-helix (wHTH) protein